MKSEENKQEKPKLSYSKIDGKPQLANQLAIEVAVEYLGKRDAYYYEGLPEFEADQKFKDYYQQKFGEQPTQENIQSYVKKLINECIEEERKLQIEKAESKAKTAKVQVGLEENLKKDEDNS